jgi:hypothetical protein
VPMPPGTEKTKRAADGPPAVAPVATGYSAPTSLPPPVPQT